MVTNVNSQESQSPGHDKIASRAYELWVLRGSPDGSPEDDWFIAERELSGKPELSTEPRTLAA